jgi:RNA polymerase sigma-70 factor (ECF subfamily)
MREHDDGRMELHADDRVESAAAAWVVREALDALTAKEHAVIRLAYYEGLTHGEIADRLAIPIGTVKSRWASGMQRLRHELTPTFAQAS